MLDYSKQLIFLAPMEGVVDWSMRHLLTQLGGIDLCVTEFIRVTNQVLPDHVFLKYFPELNTKSMTQNQTPVYGQLLGGDPQCLAENAAKLASLGSLGVDLNFGCPAKTVNRHDGGAAILQKPKRVYEITSAVRRAVPAHVPVTVKMRLGYDHKNDYLELAQYAEQAGATHITIHARTKTDGYKPPAHWDYIKKIQETIKIPVIANGEVWTQEDYKKIKQETNCSHVMIGRGAISNPWLIHDINKQNNIDNESTTKTRSTTDYIQVFQQFLEICNTARHPHFACTRIKQFIKYCSNKNQNLIPLFDQIKVLNTYEEIKASLI